MYVCDALRLVYLAQPRTASRAVARFLREEHGARLESFKGSPYGGGHHSADPAAAARYRRDGYRVVAAVRNHWDVLVSWWFCNGRKPAWPEFLAYFCGGKQNRWLEPGRLYWYLQPMADTVIRYERLDDELSAIVGERVELAPYCQSPRGHYSHYYDDERRELVACWYADELRSYGYAFETEHDCAALCRGNGVDLGGCELAAAEAEAR